MAEQLPDSARLKGCTVLLRGCTAVLLLFSLCTPALAADTTSPTKPVVTDDGAYTTDPTQLHATWTSSDPESGIAEYQYEIRLGSTKGKIVVNWPSTGTSASVTHTGLNLTQGKSYFCGVKAKNGVALWSAAGYSNGIKVDATAPTAPGQPKEGSSTDLDYDGDGQYTIYWTVAVDKESGIAAYELQEKAGSAGTWKTLTSTKTSRSFSVKNRLHNTQYFYQVRAKNKAGLWSDWSATSDGILVDKTAPTTPVVTDDGETTGDLTKFHATWTSSDPESGIVEYQYAIGTSAGATNVVGWTSHGTATEVTHTGLTLSIGTTYYFSVKAKNGAGTFSKVGTSNGIKVPAIVGGDITADTTWTLVGSPYLVTSSVTVRNNAVLTIESGVEVRFNANTGLLVGSDTAGILKAQGTALVPITFTTNSATPAPGQWGVIWFRSTTPASILDHCVIEYGGNTNIGIVSNIGIASNIRIDSSSPAIQNSTIRKSNGYGIVVIGPGLLLGSSNVHPVLTGNTFDGNGKYPLHLEIAAFPSTLSNTNASSDVTQTPDLLWRP